ncbi:pilus assembly protein [Pseudactinotalea sp. HY160]|uniref:TadE/TadG family type IV pilus assembly protein n=1 Tax=Pseudactinotalea sp. HY160 TaxID=2654490 RepID=UPI00128BD273|nr:TadE family protein [Pseudactinotalea sp. HY160]MPV49883.1 pilus assembly protein [Pseudactinotalea sp. HY160]
MSPAGAAPEHRRSDSGSAIVDFVLVSVLVITLCVGVVQLALALHVRTVLIDSAAEGARYAARYGSGLDDGARRARELITGTLPAAYAADVRAEYTPLHPSTGPARQAVVIHVRAPLPLFGLLGPAVVDVSGRAVAE